MKTTEEKVIKVNRDHCESILNDELKSGWKVKQMCAFNQSSPYAEILVVLEKEKKDNL